MSIIIEDIKKDITIPRKNDIIYQDELILKLLQIIDLNVKKVTNGTMKVFLIEIGMYIPSKSNSQFLKNKLFKIIENTPKEGWNENKLKEFVIQEKLDVRTRDHRKCQSSETLFIELLEKTDSFILHNNKYDIVHSTIRKGTHKTPTVKNDCMFEIKNELGEILLDGVQIKKLKNKKSKERIIVHNWKHTEQRKDVENHKDTTLEEKEIIEKDFENGCNEIFNLKKEWKKRTLDYKSISKQINATLLKFGMQVSDTPLFEDSKEIKSLLLKRHYIRHLYNHYHNFYHLKIYDNDLSNKNLTLQELIDRMVLMDDKEIENFKLYWHPRPVYSTSGKTQLGLEDFLKLFSKTDFSSFIDEINKIEE